MGYQRHPRTQTITEKVPVVGKVFFCICLKDIGMVLTRMKYRTNRIVATFKKSCLCTVDSQLGNQRHTPTHTITEKVPVPEKFLFRICFKGMNVVYTRVKYQIDRLVTT
jgi:hypothetical protein